MGQKQPPDVFLKKRCSEKFRKIHRKTPVPESLFLIKLLARCFPVTFTKFLRTPFSQNTSGRLLLVGKKLRRHTFSSTCFCHHRKHPINGSKIYPLPSSSCFQQHSHNWFYILRYNSDLSKLEWTQLLFKFNYIRDLTNCSPFQSLNTLLFHIRIERY